MKLLLSCFLVIALIALPTTVSATREYEQTADVCYSQCVAWEFYWKADRMLEFVLKECSMGGWESLKTVAKLGKDVATGGTGTALGIVQDAILCAVVIDAAIAPKLDVCRSICDSNMWAYGPNPAVRTRDGIYYDENRGIRIRVVNGGTSYIDEVKVDIYIGSTTSRDCNVANMKLTNYYTIRDMAPAGLEMNRDNLSWEDIRYINWEAPEDKCSVIKVVVDPEDEFPEMNGPTWGEWDNTYSITVNDLPTLPSYEILNFRYDRYAETDDVVAHFQVKNNGEMAGEPTVQLRECSSGRGLGWKEVYLGREDTKPMDFELDDLFDGDYSTQKYVCVRITVDDGVNKAETTELIPVYSGTVTGIVYDMYGKPVKDATVTADTGQTAHTDSKGKYKIVGITRMGTHVLTATSPSHTEGGKANVTFYANTTADYMSSQDELYQTGIDIVLMDRPGMVWIRCPYPGYNFRMDSGVFNYRGGVSGTGTEILGVVPGNYTMMISKSGYATSFVKVALSPGEEKVIDCGLAPMAQYNDDLGVQFSPQMKELWVANIAPNLVYTADISKDGSTIVLVVGKAPDDHYKVLVYDKSGAKVSEIPFLNEGMAVDRIYAKPSYDGSYILLSDKYLYTRAGQLVAENPKGRIEPGKYAAHGQISGDGAFICGASGGVRDRFFGELTKSLMLGQKPEGEGEYVRCIGSGGVFGIVFMPDMTMIGDCTGPGNQGVCRTRIGMDEGTELGDLRNGPLSVDASPDGSIVVAADGYTLDYIRNGAQVWRKDLKTMAYGESGDAHAEKLSVTPGGSYVALLDGPHGHDYEPHIFDSAGNDVLGVTAYNRPEYWVYDIEATGTGIYYVNFRSDRGVIFGVYGQAGVAQKQVDTGGNESGSMEWQMGQSGDSGVMPAIVLTSVTAFVLGFFAWKTGMLR